MKNIEEEFPEDQDQSAIVNQDTEFENSAVDPGFVFEETQEDASNDEKKTNIPSAEKNEQSIERDASGLGELDGTNPGSNHHPMDI